MLFKVQTSVIQYGILLLRGVGNSQCHQKIMTIFQKLLNLIEMELQEKGETKLMTRTIWYYPITITSERHIGLLLQRNWKIHVHYHHIGIFVYGNKDDFKMNLVDSSLVDGASGEDWGFAQPFFGMGVGLFFSSTVSFYLNLWTFANWQINQKTW